MTKKYYKPDFSDAKKPVGGVANNPSAQYRYSGGYGGNSNSGGGSSDFSAAMATIINNSAARVDFTVPHIEEGWFSTESYGVEKGKTDTVEVVLYKGVTSVYFEANVAVTGDAYVNEDIVVINGDCTVTLS